MKQVLIRQGRAVVEEMPAPRCGAGEVLVRSAFSLISTGTETTTLAGSTPPPAGTAWMRRARRAGQALALVRERGLDDARAAIAARLEGPSLVTGYSLAGTVLEVGAQVTDLVPGQRVACAGASSAHHAEVVAVPRNLAVAVPEGLPLARAAGVTLGAIALQGMRQAAPQLGEIIGVIGLGLLGQLTVALARAAGCRIVGTDVDPGRVERARGLGLDLGLVAGSDDVERAVDHATGGHGLDAVLLTAGTPSSEPLRQAMRLVRRKGRVVVVGAVGLDLERGPFYVKEAELRISCSYGPGRYDPSYEDRGQDYPYGFVRWTLNRNMEEVLRLAASGALPLGRLIDREVPVEEASAAYALLASGTGTGTGTGSGSGTDTGTGADRPLGVLLRYAGAEAEGDCAPAPLRRTIEVVPRQGTAAGVGIALVGPGAFANAVHLPNLAALAPDGNLIAVVGRSANAAREAARRHGAALATTDLDEALADPRVDAVLICTRHDQHAEQARRALAAGKAVFLEKPAALDDAGLEALESALAASGRPFVVGFNRRCAPDVIALHEELARRGGPCVLTYRVNAGKLPSDHWTLGPQGGGRLVGEACHMLDLLRHLTGHPHERAELLPLIPPPGRQDLPRGDNVAVSLRYADGSLATLVYTSLGHGALGKERIEAFWDGQSAVIDDFRALTVAGRPAPAPRPAPDKGHRELLRRFVACVAGAGGEPIPLAELLETSRLVLALERAARGAVDA